MGAAKFAYLIKLFNNLFNITYNFITFNITYLSNLFNEPIGKLNCTLISMIVLIYILYLLEFYVNQHCWIRNRVADI